MCRILGHFGRHFYTDDIVKLQRLMKQGGPDQQSFIKDNDWFIANNRLAIIAPSEGKQPFEFNNIIVVYNGEIYNHKELKTDVSQEYNNAIDQSDGSIIIPLYLKHGELFVRKLEGMFSICLIDKRDGFRALLYTDMCSMKPLYYHFESKELSFSSELKALPSKLWRSFYVKESIVECYLSMRSIWGPKTVYEDVSVLEPASYIVFENGVIEKKNYAKRELDAQLKLNDCNRFLIDRLSETMHTEIERMMTADVPICTTISGGLDSSYVTAVASTYKPDLVAYNIGYEGDWPQDETGYARAQSEVLGVEYRQLILPNKEIPGLVDKMICALGQPNSAPHCLSTFYLYQQIKNDGYRVALVGEGADDYFGGYDRIVEAVNSNSKHWLYRYIDSLSAVPYLLRNYLYQSPIETSNTITQALERRSDILQDILHLESQERWLYRNSRGGVSSCISKEYVISRNIQMKPLEQVIDVENTVAAAL